MQRLNALKESLAPWQAARKRLDDARTLAELAAMEDDPEGYATEISGELDGLIAGAGQAGDRDAAVRAARRAPAMLEINAGAGGADANDWASMLAADVPALGRPARLQGRNHGRSRGRRRRAEKHDPADRGQERLRAAAR